MIDLAIVIPAYKSNFLRKTLASLAQQTSLKFNVYIGDDNSPFEIKSICDEFKHLFNLSYIRFKENLGGADLVAQWERCVNLIRDEQWIWIFSDDDIAEPNCVEAFYRSLIETNSFFDVYRFNTCLIDADDNFISCAQESPTIEDSMSLTYNILLWKRGNSMPDHIFKRSAYKKNKGIVNFTQAQASDWATSINFAFGKGLYTIAGPKVKWRVSGENISSRAHKNKVKLIFGHLQFIEWVTKRFTIEDEVNSNIKLSDILDASKYNLEAVIKVHYRGIPYFSIPLVAKKISAIYHTSIAYGLFFCLRINYQLFKNSIKNKLPVQ